MGELSPFPATGVRYLTHSAEGLGAVCRPGDVMDDLQIVFLPIPPSIGPHHHHRKRPPVVQMLTLDYPPISLLTAVSSKHSTTFDLSVCRQATAGCTIQRCSSGPNLITVANIPEPKEQI